MVSKNVCVQKTVYRYNNGLLSAKAMALISQKRQIVYQRHRNSQKPTDFCKDFMLVFFFANISRKSVTKRVVVRFHSSLYVWVFHTLLSWVVYFWNTVYSLRLSCLVFYLVNIGGFQCFFTLKSSDSIYILHVQ